MILLPIETKDRLLIDAATQIIYNLYMPDKHHVGCALRTKTGEIITAVHIEAYIGRVTVCAEAIAIGKAISEGIREFEAIVAVRHPHPDEENQEVRVVAPCGMCRELISDYSPDAEVILPYEGEIGKCKIQALLPFKYSRK